MLGLGIVRMVMEKCGAGGSEAPPMINAVHTQSNVLLEPSGVDCDCVVSARPRGKAWWRDISAQGGASCSPSRRVKGGSSFVFFSGKGRIYLLPREKRYVDVTNMKAQ